MFCSRARLSSLLLGSHASSSSTTSASASASAASAAPDGAECVAYPDPIDDTFKHHDGASAATGLSSGASRAAVGELRVYLRCLAAAQRRWARHIAAQERRVRRLMLLEEDRREALRRRVRLATERDLSRLVSTDLLAAGRRHQPQPVAPPEVFAQLGIPVSQVSPFSVFVMGQLADRGATLGRELLPVVADMQAAWAVLPPNTKAACAGVAESYRRVLAEHYQRTREAAQDATRSSTPHIDSNDNSTTFDVDTATFSSAAATAHTARHSGQGATARRTAAVTQEQQQQQRTPHNNHTNYTAAAAAAASAAAAAGSISAGWERRAYAGMLLNGWRLLQAALPAGRTSDQPNNAASFIRGSDGAPTDSSHDSATGKTSGRQKGTTKASKDAAGVAAAGGPGAPMTFGEWAAMALEEWKTLTPHQKRLYLGNNSSHNSSNNNHNTAAAAASRVLPSSSSFSVSELTAGRRDLSGIDSDTSRFQRNYSLLSASLPYAHSESTINNSGEGGAAVGAPAAPVSIAEGDNGHTCINGDADGGASAVTDKDANHHHHHRRRRGPGRPRKQQQQQLQARARKARAPPSLASPKGGKTPTAKKKKSIKSERARLSSPSTGKKNTTSRKKQTRRASA